MVCLNFAPVVSVEIAVVLLELIVVIVPSPSMSRRKACSNFLGSS